MIRRPRGREGFTLIELTVALVAGLIVALGIVGLSKDATHTFHEEMRSSVAEANLRTAIDRLRADLSRASYMSTGNIALDPMIAKPPGTGNPITANPLSAGLLGLARLSSILLAQGGSAALTLLSATQDAPMNPDQIDIAGNMTSTDQYEVAFIQPPTGGGACQQITLSAQSPSMYRILGLGSAAAQELNNIFQPAGPGVGQFIVRLVDRTGHSQFLATCTGSPTGIIGAGPTAQPFILISPQTPVQLADSTGNIGGLAGYGTGSLVNAVQIVRWQIIPAINEPAQYQGPMSGQPLTPAVVDPAKYDLVRQYVDATGNAIASTTEVVAEYAVDLEFAFSVDAGLANLAPNIQTFPFDNTATNPLWAQNVAAAPPVGNQGPQRIRSVRVRLVTRASEPDRTLNVPVPNPTGPFTYRYCVVPGGCDPNNTAGVLQYARARTVTAEVALPNQSRNFYP